MDEPVLFEVASAKVNISLRVLGRRPDGFHEIDSLVMFGAVGDHLRLAVGAPVSVTTRGPFASAVVGENLVARTLALLAERAPHLKLGAITIDKFLPVAAGLGGGSANAGATLRLVKRANPEHAATVDWMALAAELGSDVPVCFIQRACHIKGRGEIITHVPGVERFCVVLVNPQVQVPPDKTAQVFRRLAAPPFDPSKPVEELLENKNAATPGERFAHMRNDLEAPATAVIPAIAEVLTTLKADRRSQLVRLSGAGPTCFAVCSYSDPCDELADHLAEAHPSWWVSSTYLGDPLSGA